MTLFLYFYSRNLIIKSKATAAAALLQSKDFGSERDSESKDLGNKRDSSAGSPR